METAEIKSKSSAKASTAGKELILETKVFAKENRWRSYLYTLSTLSFLVGAFLGTYHLPTIGLKLFCSVSAGLLMMRFFVIYHDYQHHAILHKSIPAKIIFTVYGIFMLSPASIWKRSHDYHHKHNSKLFSASIGSYPIMTLDRFLKATNAERRAYLWSRSPINMLLGYFTFFLYGMCLQSFRSSPSKHWDSLLAIILHIAVTIYFLVSLGWATWLFTLFIPFFISLMIGAYLFYAQHNFPGVTFKIKTEWNYTDAALKSSSYLKMNPVMQWLSANIGFHHIHHLNSRIPFYRLPEVMKKVPELQNPIVTTFKFSDIKACLKLKVWDPIQQKMLTLSEIKPMA